MDFILVFSCAVSPLLTDVSSGPQVLQQPQEKLPSSLPTGTALGLLRRHGTLSFVRMARTSNHRMVWVGRDLKDHLVPPPLPSAGTSSTRPGCSELHPTWPWALPGRGQPQLLWATWVRASVENFFLRYILNLPFISLKPLPLTLLDYESADTSDTQHTTYTPGHLTK